MDLDFIISFGAFMTPIAILIVALCVVCAGDDF
jgi:hypothetical protein